ncbi:cell division protein FtsZ [Caulobacter segnis]|uniref:cell division protein FtsZ n=1 Tax=Caulobacter segnis TaxID=88688 RepID=UPI002410A331|nr:cell division protein FtsZ [Caulobacter segnis]MDG2521755.1 cell division protein FtsZ [Caulobacter segnis]
MAISLSAPRTTELKPRIVVFGVGGAGGNAVNNMIEAGLEGVEFVVGNTDAQQLQFAKTDRRIQLGVQVTQGLGAGAHPEVGMSAAEESFPEIGEHLDGAHMVFITAGMGGGTGTGAAPIIAKAARERGILTVGVVTKPFHFEGRHRMRLADAGIAELQRYVDTLIVIPNQNLFRLANERTTFAEAFGMADQVLHSGVRSITDLMVLPGLINLDFADVRTVMTEMGKAMMGTGEATGEDRALMAAQNAIQNPLLDEVSLKGAKAVLVNVTGGLDMTLLEVDEAANAISDQVDPEANIIFGAAFDPSLDGVIRVSVVATGMDGAAMIASEPRTTRTSNIGAAPLIVEKAAPAAPAAAPVAAAPEPVVAPEPAYVEPVAEIEPEIAQADLYAAEPAAEYAPEPVAPQPVTRIVDPLVDDVAQDEPMFVDNRYADEPRQQKSGFFSLFGGRQRYDAAPAPAPQARAVAGGGSARPMAQPIEQELNEEGEDLEIPSFLRRLAN